jgi:diguanylate cyclase (GGDEF)-like protein
MRIRRLRTRIIVFFVALFAVVQIAALVLVNVANTHNARARAEADLDVGERVFARFLQERADELYQSARILTSDFAFREAVATGDLATITSALANHGRRIGASAMLFVGLDGKVVADTLASDRVPRPFEFPKLVQGADPGGSMPIGILGGRALQLVAVPIHSPLTIGWVIVGVPVDDAFARDLKQLTSLDVSFVLEEGASRWHPLASTLADPAQHQLITSISGWSQVVGTHVTRLGEEDHQARVIALESIGGQPVFAVLGRSLTAAIASFASLRAILAALVLAGLVVSFAGSVLIAGNITRPLSELATAAGRIEQGDYGAEVGVQRADEVGRLASSLNHMRDGIAERERRILKLAYHDPLTDLANRSKFSERLAQSIGEVDASQRGVSILVMDLDRFKYVNDALGHTVGDHVLLEVGKRLLETAPDAACIARLGGDEFAVLLAGAPTARAVDIARSINRALEQPILYLDQPLDVGASIGIAHYPEHGDDAPALIRNADIAMYVSKRDKSGYAIYDRHYDTTQQRHLSLLSELRQAVEGRQLRLYYQPKVSFTSGNVSAVEALLR